MKAQPNHPVTFSHFDNYYDTNPDIQIWTLKEFIKEFAIADQCEDKKRCECINLSCYGDTPNAKNSLRNQANIESVSGLILDIDNKQEPFVTIEKIRSTLADYTYVAHTTFSSTPKHPRYRVLIIFSKPTSPEHIPTVFDYFNKQFGERIDEVSGNPNQIYLIPACSLKKLKEYRRFVNKGELFDPESVPYKPIEPPKENKTRQRKTKGDIASLELEQVDLDEIHVEEESKYLIITGDSSNYDWDRSRVSFRVICDLVVAGCSDETIASILMDPDYGISARHREKGLEWVRQEIDRARKKDKKHQRMFPDALPFYVDENVLETDEAIRRLEDKIRSFIENPSGYKGIKAPAGLGKTVATIRVLAKTNFRLVEYYVPRHSLAKEVAELFRQKAPHLNVVVIRGRTYEDDSGHTLCAKADIASKLSDHGIGIYKTLCRGEDGASCEHFASCPYLAQFKKSTHVRIFTHAHLPLKRGFLDKDQPDFAIIDESFFSSMIDYRRSSIDDLEKIYPRRLGSVIRSALLGRRPLLAELKRQFGDELSQILSKARKSMKRSKVELGPSMNKDQIDRAISAAPIVPQAIRILLLNLERELELFLQREHSRVVLLYGTRLYVAHRKHITRLTLPGKDPAVEANQIPTLCIDADLSVPINRVFLPGFKKHEISARRRAHVIQVSSTRNSRSRFMARPDRKGTETQRARLHVRQHQELINRICENKRGLIVGYEKVMGNPKKDMPPILRTPPNCDAIHFGALRGIDRYKDYDVVIIVGRHQYPTEILEAMGASLWWDQRVPLKLGQDMVEEVRGYRLARGTGGVNVMVHPDRRIQLLQEQLRECESTQAIDRLRLIHTKIPKEVWILSNIPLDIDVDRLVTARDLMKGGNPIEQAFAQYDGVMPLSPQFLYENHGDLFGSETAAKKVVSRFKKAGASGDTEVSDGLYLDTTHTLCHLLTYRVQGAPGKPKSALCDREIPAQTVKKRLRRLHGAPITIIDRESTGRESGRKKKAG